MLKIEELTLYTLQQQKEIEQLRKKNETLNALMEEVERLKMIISATTKDEHKVSII